MAMSIVSSRLGPLLTCEEMLLRAGDPRIFATVPQAMKNALFLPASVPAAGGAGYTRQQALDTAVGEFVERYASVSYRASDLRLASADELGAAAIGFDQFELYSAAQLAHEQFTLPRYRPDLPIRWCAARALDGGAARWVPACLVYLSYGGEDGDQLTFAVSTGTACHRTPDAAALTGLYEVVERDAFMIAWLNRLPLRRIDFLADAQLRALYDRHYRGTGLVFHLFEMTTDLAIPSVLCLVEGRSPRGALFAVGAATRLCERDAAAKAMLEAASDVLYARSLLREKPEWRPTRDYLNVREFEDHVRLYCEAEMGEHLRFLLDQKDARPLAPPAAAIGADAGADDKLARCTALVRARGYDPVVVDLTPDDVAALGFHCRKVLIPGAVPMTAIHGLTPLGSRRLRSVPVALGWLAEPPTHFNRIPHPFP